MGGGALGDLVGKKVGGYEILELLGQGSMGVVFKAKQLSMDRIVALKVLPTKLAQDQTYVQRFITEARAAGRLNHPYIVGVYDVVKFANTYAFSMDYVDGQTVRQRLEETGPLREDEALGIVRQVAAALAEAHSQGILHRDVKPDNIMLDRDGKAMLSDLGLAKVTKPGRGSTTSGQSAGTPLYMSTEEAKAEAIDHRSDIYSLGATLFHMVTGEPPFDGPTAAAVIVKHATEKVPDASKLYPNVSIACSRLIRRMMAKSPGSRPDTAFDVINAVDKALASDPGERTARQRRVGTATQSTQTTETPGMTSRQKYGVIAAAAVVVICALVFGIVTMRRRAAERRRKQEIRLAEEQRKAAEAEVKRKAAEAAAASYEAFAAIVEWCEANPEDLEGWRTGYLDFLEKHPESAEAERARLRIEDIAKLIAEKRVKDKYEALVARANAMAARLRYGEAVTLLRERARSGDRFAAKANAAAAGIVSQARAKYGELKAAADALSDAGRFDAAKAMLRPVMEDFGIAELLTAAQAACREYDELAAGAALAADRKVLGEAVRKAGGLVKAYDYDGARDAMLEAERRIADAGLKAQARQFAGDYDAAHKAFSHTQMRLSIGSRTKLALVGLRTGLALGMDERGLKIERRGNMSVLSWSEVPPSTIAKLALRNMSDQDGTDYRDIGVLAMLVGAWVDAKEVLTKAAALDPTLQKDVERYMKVVEPEITAADERAAEKLFGEAQESARHRLTVKVAWQVKALKEKYGHTTFVKSRSDEIDALIGGKVAAAPGPAGSPKAPAKEEDPDDPVVKLKKLGWSVVKGNWKVDGDLFTAEGNVRLETGRKWEDMAVTADIHMTEGEKFHVLLRYNPGVFTYGGAPPGYGVVVEEERIRIIGGIVGWIISSSADGDGRPEERRSEFFNGTAAHKYTMSLKGRNFSIFVDGKRLYKHQLNKHNSGTVAIYGNGIKLKIRAPMARRLP